MDYHLILRDLEEKMTKMEIVENDLEAEQDDSSKNSVKYQIKNTFSDLSLEKSLERHSHKDQISPLT